MTATILGGDSRLYSIGDLAGELGLSARAIRFYEDHALVKPRRIGGNRVFTHRDRARLVLIQRGKRLGFSLAAIKEMLAFYDVDPDHLQQLQAALAKGRKRIAELEAQREAIAATLRELREIETTVVGLIREKERSRGARGQRRQGGAS